MGYVVLHLDKSPSNESAMTEHIARKKIHPNVDPTRIHLNKELIEFPEGVNDRTEAIQYRLKTAGLKRQVGKNQVQVIRFMLSGSADDMKRIQNEGRLDEWCQDNIDYLKKTFGEENVVAATLHLDETTPHIHASVVPIVQGERRKKKKPRQEPKRQYKKKNPKNPRLCADDVMARVKLTEYQDTYAEAMKKYGLERGIKGSEARHISLTEHFRNQAIQSKNLQENIELLLAVEEAKRRSIEKLRQQEQEAKQKLKAEEFKNKAADVGSILMDGLGSIIGTSKAKRQQQEIDSLKDENQNLKQEMTGLKQSFAHKQQDSERVIAGLEAEINKINDWLPETSLLIKWGEYCRKIGFTKAQAKDLVNMKPIYFSGQLYSHEHSQKFEAKQSEIRLERNPNNPGIFRLLIDKISIIQWFRQKHKDFLESIKVKINPRTSKTQGKRI